MNWEDIIGQNKLINTLKEAIDNGRLFTHNFSLVKKRYGGSFLALLMHKKFGKRK